jgi:cell division transport system permease protein
MKRALRTAIKHIRRSPFHSLGAILILSITFYLLSRFVLELAATDKVLKHFESLPQAIAFFSDQATPEDISSLQNKLETTSSVASMKFVSKEEALKIYQEQNKDDPLLLEMVTADILPASLEVSAISPDALPKLAEIMRSHEGVEEVAFNQDITDRLNDWGRSIRVTGLARLTIFSIGSLMIIMLAISTKVASKKKEIEVMNLIGATKGYIVLPFLAEGVIYGLVSSFVGWGFAYLELLYSTPIILKYFGDIDLLPVPILFMFLLLGAEMAIGILVGVFTSLLAARRFLK